MRRRSCAPPQVSDVGAGAPPSSIVIGAESALKSSAFGWLGSATPTLHDGARSHFGHWPQSVGQASHVSPVVQTLSPQTAAWLAASVPDASRHAHSE